MNDRNMVRYIFLLLIFFGMSCYSYTQEIFQRKKKDHQWLTGGRSYQGTTDWGGTMMDFNSDSINLFYYENPINFDITNASICDISGQYLFHTNGISIANYTGEIMENGERINPGSFGDNWSNLGIPLDQAALILQMPTNDSLFYIFHETLDYTTNNPDGNSAIVKQLYYSVINMLKNNGIGRVEEKDIIIIPDSLDAGKITSCRHANGRDWWLLFHQYNSNKYYEVLFDPQGARIYDEIVVGDSLPATIGQSFFTPNGKKFINIVFYRGDERYIVVYDFDRTTGSLSNPVTIPRLNQMNGITGGGSMSENSRFLYYSEYDKLFQYDLEADDIEASLELVAIRDEEFTSPPLDAKVNFFLHQLAPDGKIYISSFSQTLYYSVIHNPNVKGLSCNAENHGLEILTYSFRNAPNFPYYGLGSLDGSPADTLGIDNPPPTARYEYVQDSSDIYKVDFYDGTLFPPEACMYEVPYDAYTWDFDDGTQSHEQHPIHIFSEDGIYEVCLTVYNHTGSDTYCDSIYINIVNINEPEPPLSATRLFPNPADDILYFDYLLESNIKAQAGIYDMYGRLIHQRPLLTGNVSQSWDVNNFQPGVYFFVVEAGSRVIYREKVLIL